jgi:hypothetical protein
VELHLDEISSATVPLHERFCCAFLRFLVSEIGFAYRWEPFDVELHLNEISSPMVPFHERFCCAFLRLLVSEIGFASLCGNEP